MARILGGEEKKIEPYTFEQFKRDIKRIMRGFG